MKRLLTLEIYKPSLDPLNNLVKIRIKVLNRWTIATWTYNRETGLSQENNMPRKNPRLEDYNQRVGSHKDYYGDILLGVFIGAWITLCFGILVFGLVVEGLIS